MSNTTRVTPYASIKRQTLSRLKESVDRVRSNAGKFQSTVKWLLAEIPETASLTNRYREECRFERLQREVQRVNNHNELLSVTTVELNLREPDSLFRSAEKLDYRPVSIDKTLQPLRGTDSVLLAHPSGERLALERNHDGRLLVHTTASLDRVQRIVRQHTLDRALEYLAAQGMTVQERSLPGGDVEIQARQSEARREAPGAEINLHVNADGTAVVDIDQVRGKRCVQIVDRLAKATNTEIAATRKKGAFFQLPSKVSRKAKVRL